MQRETDRAADEADLRDDLDTEEDEPVEVSEPVSKPNGEAKQSEPSAGDDMEQEEKNEGGLYIVMIRCGLPGSLHFVGYKRPSKAGTGVECSAKMVACPLCLQHFGQMLD
jgi:hypothetical protein